MTADSIFLLDDTNGQLVEMIAARYDSAGWDTVAAVMRELAAAFDKR